LLAWNFNNGEILKEFNIKQPSPFSISPEEDVIVCTNYTNYKPVENYVIDLNTLSEQKLSLPPELWGFLIALNSNDMVVLFSSDQNIG
jgi:hypothetical protein